MTNWTSAYKQPSLSNNNAGLPVFDREENSPTKADGGGGGGQLGPEKMGNRVAK